MDRTGNEFWALFLFGGMVICFGYILELNFIRKGAEAFGMQTRSRAPGAATTAHQVPTPSHQVNQQAVEVPAITFSTNGHSKH